MAPYIINGMAVKYIILKTAINGLTRMRKLKMKIKIPDTSGSHHIEIFIFLSKKALLILETARKTIQNPVKRINALTDMCG